MAKASFHCSDCDRAITIEGRNRADADRRARRCTDQRERCWECEKRARQEAAAAEAIAQGLPELAGVSAKQVAYATVKRGEALRVLDEATRRMVDCIAELFHDAPALATEVGDAAALLVAEAKANTQAKFWLDTNFSGSWGEGYIFKHLMARQDLIPQTYAACETHEAERAARRAARSAGGAP